LPATVRNAAPERASFSRSRSPDVRRHRRPDDSARSRKSEDSPSTRPAPLTPHSPRGGDARPCDLRVRDSFPMAFHPSKLFPQHQPYPVTPVSRVHQRPLPSRRSPARYRPVHPPPKRTPNSLILRPVIDLKALLQCRVRCTHVALPLRQCPMLPWAS
jgi:hypothetical protein